MAPLLSLTEVSHRRTDGWRERMVLDDVSLTIERGDFVGLFGNKRAGKSTLLRIMAGMEQPAVGAVHFEGQLVTAMSARRRARLLRREGIALASSEWRPQLIRPAVELVATACASDGTAMTNARLRARYALRRVEAADCADTSVDRLSAGQRLRICLAMALVREPRLLLVDEPAVLPSPMESEDLYSLLRSLGEERDLAVVIASEDLTPLVGTCRRMIISSGQVRSMDAEGVVVRLPVAPPSNATRAGDAG
jgi:putative ABC transport system ATP-binding protein